MKDSAHHGEHLQADPYTGNCSCETGTHCRPRRCWCRKQLFLLYFVISCGAWFHLSAGTGAAQDQESTDQASPVEVNLEQVQARVAPDFQLVLPYGNLELFFREEVGRFAGSFSLDYRFLSNSVGASLSLSRPSRVVTPAVRMHTRVEFENYLLPELRDGDFTLVPSDKYVFRERGVDLGVDFTISGQTHATAAFLVSDVFRGDLSESEVLASGTDLTFRSTFAYDGVVQLENRGGAFLTGTHASSDLDLSFRDSFHDPIALEHSARLLLYRSLARKLGTRVNLSMSYPLKLWRRELSSYYQLGGYCSVRGYPEGELGAFRYALLTSDLQYRLIDLSATLPEIAEHRLRLSRVSPYVLIDVLLYQDSLDLDSQTRTALSLGGGISVNLVAGSKRHFTVRLSLAQPLQRGYTPALYLTMESSPFRSRGSGETLVVD
ncbi:MAG: hypothetical protein ACOC8N_02205 [Spirochaetota bacterium]